ncbi:unnamed protein product [Leptosia nina]|uniref:Uncharacterized protein n=1 Tax=Leptosia nina TaxID=320188 RepID=A0AAV1IYA9_9NEOP
MKLSVSAYRAHASAHKKILTSSYQQHYGSTAAPPVCNPVQPPNFTPQIIIIGMSAILKEEIEEEQKIVLSSSGYAGEGICAVHRYSLASMT